MKGANAMAKTDKFEVRCLKCGGENVDVYATIHGTAKFECRDCKEADVII